MNYYDDINEKLSTCAYCGKTCNSTECMIIADSLLREKWFCDETCKDLYYENFKEEENE